MQNWSADGVRLERTGWRDESISQRHRAWGFHCPVVNIDFLMVEYNHGAPVALIEFKHWKARFPDLRHPTYRALHRLADGYKEGPLPFLVAFYWPEVWAFRTLPVNDTAARHFSAMYLMTERDFVRRLYRLRELTVAAELKGRLGTMLPRPPAVQQAMAV